MMHHASAHRLRCRNLRCSKFNDSECGSRNDHSNFISKLICCDNINGTVAEVENSSTGVNEFSESDGDFESDSDYNERENELNEPPTSATANKKSKEKKRVSTCQKKSKGRSKSGDKLHSGSKGKRVR